MSYLGLIRGFFLLNQGYKIYSNIKLLIIFLTLNMLFPRLPYLSENSTAHLAAGNDFCSSFCSTSQQIAHHLFLSFLLPKYITNPFYSFHLFIQPWSKPQSYFTQITAIDSIWFSAHILDSPNPCKQPRQFLGTQLGQLCEYN